MGCCTTSSREPTKTIGQHFGTVFREVDTVSYQRREAPCDGWKDCFRTNHWLVLVSQSFLLEGAC